MVDINKLKGKIVEKGYSVATLAERLPFSSSTFYRKLEENGTTISIGEADAIATLLDLNYSEIMDIFFAQIVA